MAVSVVSTAAVQTTTASPSLTFGSWTPALNDVVLLWSKVVSTAITITVPAGWVNCDPSGGNTNVSSDTGSGAAIYHLVTSGEVSGVTTTYTATSLWNSTVNGNVTGIVLRGVDSTTPIDSSAVAFDNANTVTPHVLPALVGANLSSNSLVVGCVAADGNGTYDTNPSGWTIQIQNNAFTRKGSAIATRDTLTTAGSNVAATNITPSVGDEYVSYTIAFTEFAPTSTNQFFALF